MQSYLAVGAWAGATTSGFTAWDAVELGALALLAIAVLYLWRRVRRPVSESVPKAKGLPLVVVAAAVAAVIDEPHRIVGITEVREPRSPSNPWSVEGRRALFASHRIR